MKNLPAKIISVIFHPLLLPTYAVILMFIFPTFLSNYQFEYQKIVLIIIFIFTCMIPISLIMLMLFLKTVGSINLKDRRERTYPYVLVCIIYIGAYYFSVKFPPGIPVAVNNFILTATIIIFFIMLINFKIKVSAHMAGIGGFLSFFYVFIMNENINDSLFTIMNFNLQGIHFFGLIILVAAVIATARLSLNAHNMKQILLGFFVGFAVGLINIFF